ncbi:MAG: hypothetical protein CVU39_09400 [Chloroflexi bacterium HGW-Chloroflexi-10]|nr:MAG: hypothetical protein CVU39_09400 [Chloroflexi bacterium HGW-Chloroflexi-10]
MSDNSVTPISRVEPEAAANRAVQVQSMKTEAARSSQEAQEVKQAAEMQSRHASESKPALEAPKTSDIGLKFTVNEETKQVTVYVIDRATSRVIRSIPPDELNNLKAGDLVELLA